MEPAAVIGLEFERPAVEALAPEAVRPAIDKHLDTLARKHFIDLTGTAQSETIYRFHHHLVRDTVYNGLLKRTRANLHLAFVRWADKVNADRDRALEFEEILGYHLEQAYLYLGELGPLDEAGVAIGVDASGRLANAARRAFARGDMHAAANLYRRAIALLARDDAERAELLPQFGETLMGLGDYASARAAVKEAAECSERLANPRIKASSEIVGMLIRLHSGEPGDWSESTLSTAHALIPALERESAHGELAMTWRLIVRVHGIAGRYGLVSEAVSRSIKHARLAGNPWLAEINGVTFAHVLLLGPTPVPQAIAECEALLADGLNDRLTECQIMCTLAQLKAMRGDLAQARDLYRRSRATLRDMGQGVFAASTGLDLLLVELHGGDLGRAEREVRGDFEFLTSVGETYALSTLAALLSRVVRDQGRDEEALALSRTAEAASAADDLDSQALWRSIRAPIVARSGQPALAEELARTAVDMVLMTEAPNIKADALSELASVLHLCGKRDEARQAAGQAISLYDQKGNIVSANRQRALIEALDGGVGTGLSGY